MTVAARVLLRSIPVLRSSDNLTNDSAGVKRQVGQAKNTAQQLQQFSVRLKNIVKLEGLCSFF